MSFYWNFMSSFWRRAFLFFSLLFAKYLFAFLFMGYFIGFGSCAWLEIEVYRGSEKFDFPFFGVFIGCLCISFIVALFEAMGVEEGFCKNCIDELKKDFIEGDITEYAFKTYYNRLKPLRAKWEQSEEARKQEEETTREREKREELRYERAKERRKAFLKKFKEEE